MLIKKIEANKLDYIDLLLEADPEVDVVTKYIEGSDMFGVFENNKVLSVIVITKVDEDICELKNIATLEEERDKGYASELIEYVFNEYRGKYKMMVVGTGESMIPFYVLNGFTKYYKTVKNFFIDNYKEEIWDNGLQCIDMYYYSKEL